MNHDKQKVVLEQYAEGSIHGVEMIESMLATIEPADLREYFMTSPVEFDRKLGLEPQPGVDEASRKKDMQRFAARLMNCAAALLAGTFDRFVPTIARHADGVVIVVEQQDFENPTVTHVIGKRSQIEDESDD